MTQFTRILLLAFVAFVLTGGVVAYTIQEDPEELPVVLKPVHDAVVRVVPSLDTNTKIAIQVEEAPMVNSVGARIVLETEDSSETESEATKVNKGEDISKIREILANDGEARIIVLAAEGVPAEDILETLSETDFVPSHVFEVTNGFAGTVDVEVFNLLYDNDQVKSISLDEPVGTN